MSKIILSDVDGVLLHWTGSLPFFLKEKGMKTDHVLNFYTEEEVGLWPPEKLFPESEDPLNTLMQYLESDYMRSLSPYVDAIEVVNRLSKEGYKFIAVTAMANNPRVVSMRKDNIEALFPGVFEDIVHVGVGESKLDAFKRIVDQYGEPILYVDDFTKHIAEWNESCLNGMPFLMYRGRDVVSGSEYNCHVVNDWYDIEYYLSDEESFN